jgi:hypothetical protein
VSGDVAAWVWVVVRSLEGDGPVNVDVFSTYDAAAEHLKRLDQEDVAGPFEEVVWTESFLPAEPCPECDCADPTTAREVAAECECGCHR